MTVPLAPIEYAYQPGDRCPKAWVDPDGMIRVTLTRRPTEAHPTMVEVTVGNDEPVTRACAGQVIPELRTRRLIL